MAGNAILKQFLVSLDIKRSTSNRPFEVVEGDTGNQIVVTLTDDGEAVDCTNRLVAAVFSSSKGTAVQDSCYVNSGIEIEQNRITINLHASSIAPGMVECELQVYSSLFNAPTKREDYDTLITSAKFNFSCRRAILNDDTLESFPQLPLLTELCDGVALAEEAREAAEQERETAEAQRMLAEALREAAEDAREIAESHRVIADEARQEAYDAVLESVGGSGVIYLTGMGAPTADLIGALGQLYLDLINKQAYICVSVNAQSDKCEWKQVFICGDDGSGIAGIRAPYPYSFENIPKNAEISFGELMGRLSAWYDEIADKQDLLSFDGTPTQGSQSPVTSGGVYTALEGKLSANGDGSALTVNAPQTPTVMEQLSSGDALSRAYGTINAIYDWTKETDAALANAIMENGDGSSVKVSRGGASADFADIPVSDPISLQNLLQRLGGWYSEICSKQAALSFDDSPTKDSSNPVTSGGVYAAEHSGDWEKISDCTLSANAGVLECNARDGGGAFNFDELRITILGNLIGDNQCILYVNGVRERCINISSFMVLQGGSSREAIATLHLMKPAEGFVQFMHSKGGVVTAGLTNTGVEPVRYGALSFGSVKGAYAVNSYNGVKLLFDVNGTGGVYMAQGSRMIVEGRNIA